LIITNSKAKKKGAHFEHLNYHLLSILIVVYHDLLSDAKEINKNRRNYTSEALMAFIFSLNFTNIGR